MTLRLRLVLGLLVVAAIGLLVLGGVTYVEQRRFLLERADAQARAGVQVVSARLGGHDPFDPPRLRGGRRGGPFGLGGAVPGAGAPGGGGPGGPRGVGVPSGLYGERRAPDGRTLATVVVRLGERAPSPPVLPADLGLGEPVTVPARDGSLQYRAYATPTPPEADARPVAAGGLTVAAVPLTDVEATLDRLLLVEALVVVAVLLVLGALSWVLVGLGLRPLERITRTADGIAAGELSRRVDVAGPRTEVGRVGLALNAMLDRIERAFAGQRASEERLRRFLADAAHELRTPLASVRGYAELHRLGALADPGEADRAMGRVERESARMGTLVEDLLTLARLDEEREPVREAVDLAAVARDVVADARASAADRDIALDAPQAVAVQGDPDRLHQVLANLVANALAHTPAGTPVEVGVRRGGPGGDGAELRVRDHGPGLPVADGSVIFERFWRDDEARGRGPAGAGLGLAIVAGVVAAHDGRVRAEDAEGGGARFVVELPAEPRRGETDGSV